MYIPIISEDDSEPIATSFLIEWDKDAGQFRMVSGSRTKR
jgi:hypothetical protein